MSLKYDVNLGHDAVPTLAPASVSSGESSTTSCGSLEGTSLFDVSSSSSTSSSTTSSSTCHPALPTVIQASHRRKVSFGDVTFRSYPVILGDHPDCVGPPVSLSSCPIGCLVCNRVNDLTPFEIYLPSSAMPACL